MIFNRCLPLWTALTIFTFAPGLKSDELNGHQVRLDSQGKIVPWIEPADQAYEEVLRRAWRFLATDVPVESNGLKSYFTYCCLDLKTMHGTHWPHNPACVNAGLAESAALWFAYSGDSQPIQLVKDVLDYQLAHGSTPPGWVWSNVPYASSEDGAVEYRGVTEHKYATPDEEAIGDGYGVIEPDKVGELGLGYLRFFELTGDRRYLDAAIACANALSQNVREGDFFKSPWPFRVYAENGRPREQYSSNVIFPIRLFDDLIRLNLGNPASYQKARTTAWTWLMKFPMRDLLWSGYFEDVYQERLNNNLNQYSPMETARYLMEHPETDPEWKTHVATLIDFVERHFTVDIPREPGLQWGAVTVSEQLADMNKMGSHTSRYGAVLATWSELTGDTAAKEKAWRSLTWASYMCRENGFVNVGPVDQSLWFSDGYGDFIKHFLKAMAAYPEWTPRGTDHVLQSASIVRKVEYRKGLVKYETFDRDSVERIKLSFQPASVAAGGKRLGKREDLKEDGYTLRNGSDGSYLLEVKHSRSGEVNIAAQ